jgi:hypothetical protein
LTFGEGVCNQVFRAIKSFPVPASVPLTIDNTNSSQTTEVTIETSESQIPPVTTDIVPSPVPIPRVPGYGDEIEGRPNWQERIAHDMINAVRLGFSSQNFFFFLKREKNFFFQTQTNTRKFMERIIIPLY